MSASSIKSWSFISATFAKSSLRDKLHVYLRQKLAPWELFFHELQSEGNLLDYGCGHGLLLALCGQVHPNISLYGIDHDEEKTEIVKKCLPDVTILEAASLTANYPEYFDCVVICDMLYCNNPQQQEKILCEIRKSMKPGGRLLIKETVAVPKMKYYFLLLHELVMIRILKLTKGRELNILRPDGFKKLLAVSGFTVQKNKPIHAGYLHPHHLFLCVK